MVHGLYERYVALGRASGTLRWHGPHRWRKDQPYTDELFFEMIDRGVIRRRGATINTASLSTLASATTCTTGIEWLGQAEQAKYQQLAKAAQLNRTGGTATCLRWLRWGKFKSGWTAL